MFVGLALEAEQDCHQHHTQAHPNHSPYHGPAASESVCKYCGKCAADDEHDLNTSANDLREVLAETDIGVEDGWDVVTIVIYPLATMLIVLFNWCVHNEVDPSDLVHELHSVGQETGQGLVKFEVYMKTILTSCDPLTARRA